jgi:hypothetical protein
VGIFNFVAMPLTGSHAQGKPATADPAVPTFTKNVRVGQPPERWKNTKGQQRAFVD